MTLTMPIAPSAFNDSGALKLAAPLLDTWTRIADNVGPDQW
jgi:hypothetical protein